MTADRRPRLLTLSAGAASECGLVALLWFCMDALQHLRLTPGDFLLTCGVWLVFVVAEHLAVVRLEARWRPVAAAAFAALPGVVIAGWNPSLKHPLSVGEIAYAVMLLAAARWIWRRWSVAPGVSPASEYARRWLVAVGAFWAVLPFITDSAVGGVDAHWYGNMLMDFLAQARAGRFPVFLGQSQWAFNGAVHPFRTAPMYLWVGGVWDLLTARTLSMYSLQHLTAVSASLVAGLGMYGGLCALAPGRRWAAAFCASLYVLCPSLLGPLYCADMYMTYMAAASLPLVFVGNAGLILSAADRKTQLMLAAGLALVWMSHPPTALIASLMTVALQIGGHAFRGEPILKSLRAWTVVAVIFLGLSLYYFASMSENPPAPGPSPRMDVVWLGGICLVTLGAAEALNGRRRIGLAGLLTGTLLLILSFPAWGVWAGFFLAGMVVAVVLRAQLKRTWSPAGSAGAILLASILAAGAAWPIASAAGWPAHSEALQTLELHHQAWIKFFLPLSEHVALVSDFQLGWSIWLLLLAAWLLGLARGRPSAVFGWVLILVSLLVIPIGGVSSFFVGFAPSAFARITSLPLVLRMMPGTAACAVVGGFLALASVERRGLRAFSLGLLAVATAWSAFQAGRFVERGRNATLSYPLSLRSARSENALLYRFAYDLLPIPAYFSNGKMDPRLESRFLSQRYRVLIGPEQISRAMEKEGERVIDLRTRIYEGQPDWLRIEPELWVAPWDDLLLRFEFDPEFNYTGYLIFQSPVGNYREYQLPDSGMPAGFGAGPGRSKVLSVWNTGNVPERYEFSHFLKPGNTLAPDIRYARLHVSRFVERASPIQLESLIPYQVTVTAPENGFLESPRVYLPGYVATVDRHRADVLESQQRLAMIPVPAGRHTVRLEFRGTPRLWTGVFVSLACWLGLLGYAWRRRGAGRPATARD